MSLDDRRDLIVLGGGATGLAAAYMAARAGLSVTVVEAAPHVGGLLSTFPVGGTRLEHYYHHFFTHDVELHWFLNALGLGEEIVYAPSTMGVLRDGKTHGFNGPMDLLRFKPLGLLDRVRFGMSSLWLATRANWSELEDQSAVQWLERVAGRKATEVLWGPMLDVKFGQHASDVPLSWMVGRLRQRVRSRQGTREHLGYLKGSLQVLLDRLIESLADLDVRVVCGEPVTGLDFEAGVKVRTTEATYRGDRVLSTIPTDVLATLVFAHDAHFSEQLAAIEYFGAACTILELEESFSDIYWLNVADSGFPFGGIIEHTNLVSPDEYGGRHIIYLSRYFARNDPLAKLPEKILGAMMTAPLKRIHPQFDPRSARATHVFRTMTAAPVCDLGFSKRVPECRSPIDRLYVTGMCHVYPDERSTNNSIRVAAEALEVMGVPTEVPDRVGSLAGQVGMKK